MTMTSARFDKLLQEVLAELDFSMRMNGGSVEVVDQSAWAAILSDEEIGDLMALWLQVEYQCSTPDESIKDQMRLQLQDYAAARKIGGAANAAAAGGKAV
jgi:hypothetical protein